MENSKIEWTDHTFNPWMGCTKVSPGCRHCYAETLMATRYGKVQWGKGKERVRTAPENWRKPRLWNKAATGALDRPRVFCASLADWLDDEVPIEWLADLLALIHATPNLDWLLLTKRPENWRSRVSSAMVHLSENNNDVVSGWLTAWFSPDMGPPANVWIGTSIENQELANKRVPLLLDIPAAVHFLSVEPMLEHIDLFRACFGESVSWPHVGALRFGVDWVICGGESGRGARIMKEAWVISLRDQCRVCGDVAFHFKQWGGQDKKAAGRILDGRTWDELPMIRNLQYA